MKKKSTSQSAFFNLRVLIGLFVFLAGVFLALLGFGAFSNLFAQRPQQPRSQQPLVQAQYRGVMPVVKFDISPPLRDMKPLAAKECTLRENEEQGPIPAGPVGPVVADPVVQRVLGKIGIPAPIISFDGNPNLCGCAPPDPNGAVGPNHVVTMANLHFQIFNKTGTSLFGPAANNTLWTGFGGDCETDNAGDPVVLYDQLADRWLLTQFTSSGPTFFECVALSQTNDPTGSYFRWAISTGINFPDYPKAGMWPDAYYFSTREFANGSTFVGVGAYALDRAQALVGNPNPTIVGFLAPPGGTPYNIGDGLLPSDLDGTTLPPANSPNYFVGSMDNNGPYGAPQDALTVWKFHYDPVTPGNSTFTLTNTLPTAPFNSILSLCGGTRNCIPQPGTANRIDHLGYRQRPLFRLAYRNFGTHESLVTNQSVSAGTGPNGEVSGVRWWELRDPNGSPLIFQEGTYAPGLTDGIHRWMGSIAMNSLGDMALAYSASNGTNPSVFPSVFYTARNSADPPGQMTLGEGSIINGTGSQTAGGNRWGDYTSIDLDPVDDTTFWVVNEYLPTTSGSGWRLRVGAFNLAGGPTPTPTPTATPTPTPGCTPVAFTNPAPISIPDSGPATPYPSDIVVSGLPGPVTKVTVTINGLTHTFPSDLDFLLVGPAGQNAIIWSDAGGSDDVTGIVVTLDDDAATPLPDVGPLLSGTYQPANYGTGDVWPAPAPAPLGGSALSIFNGTDPNGTWSLYLVDGFALDLGEITGGWTLSICAGGATPTPTPTPTPTATPTATPTPTPPPTPTPTPTPSVTPVPRPTPGPSATPRGSPPPRP